MLFDIEKSSIDPCNPEPRNVTVSIFSGQGAVKSISPDPFIFVCCLILLMHNTLFFFFCKGAFFFVSKYSFNKARNQEKNTTQIKKQAKKTRCIFVFTKRHQRQYPRHILVNCK